MKGSKKEVKFFLFNFYTYLPNIQTINNFADNYQKIISGTAPFVWMVNFGKDDLVFIREVNRLFPEEEYDIDEYNAMKDFRVHDVKGILTYSFSCTLPGNFRPAVFKKLLFLKLNIPGLSIKDRKTKQEINDKILEEIAKDKNVHGQVFFTFCWPEIILLLSGNDYEKLENAASRVIWASEPTPPGDRLIYSHSYTLNTVDGDYYTERNPKDADVIPHFFIKTVISVRRDKIPNKSKFERILYEICSKRNLMLNYSYGSGDYIARLVSGQQPGPPDRIRYCDALVQTKEEFDCYLDFMLELESNPDLQNYITGSRTIIETLLNYENSGDDIVVANKHPVSTGNSSRHRSIDLKGAKILKLAKKYLPRYTAQKLYHIFLQYFTFKHHQFKSVSYNRILVFIENLFSYMEIQLKKLPPSKNGSGNICSTLNKKVIESYDWIKFAISQRLDWSFPLFEDATNLLARSNRGGISQVVDLWYRFAEYFIHHFSKIPNKIIKPVQWEGLILFGSDNIFTAYQNPLEELASLQTGNEEKRFIDTSVFGFPFEAVFKVNHFFIHELGHVLSSYIDWNELDESDEIKKRIGILKEIRNEDILKEKSQIKEIFKVISLKELYEEIFADFIALILGFNNDIEVWKKCFLWQNFKLEKAPGTMRLSSLFTRFLLLHLLSNRINETGEQVDLSASFVLFKLVSQKEEEYTGDFGTFIHIVKPEKVDEPEFLILKDIYEDNKEIIHSDVIANLNRVPLIIDHIMILAEWLGLTGIYKMINNRKHDADFNDNRSETVNHLKDNERMARSIHILGCFLQNKFKREQVDKSGILPIYLDTIEQLSVLLPETNGEE